ncbi:MAG: hypothetical protein HQK60_07085 [Deltaproteobacteria bacterium]|nr:hypothetical protein [Deltaproteobacteria bacterium]
MNSSGWLTDNAGHLIASLNLDEGEHPAGLKSGYRSFLETWNSLTHPAAFRMSSFQVEIAGSNNLDTLKAAIVLSDKNGFDPIEPLLVTLLPFEKVNCLKQSLDFACFSQEHNLPCRDWDPANLYMHRTNVIRWVPPSPSAWAQRNKPSHWLDDIVVLALRLFQMNIPQSDLDWKQLARTEKVPIEWRLFLTCCHSLKTKLSRDYYLLTNSFSFLFYQAWIYTAAVRLAMKDNLLSSPEFDLLHHLRAGLGLSEVQAQALDVVAQKAEPSWDDLTSILRIAKTTESDGRGISI